MRKPAPPENPLGLKTGKGYRFRFKRADGTEDTMDGWYTGYQLIGNTISILAFDGHFKLTVTNIIGYEERG